jgi:glutaredoxin
LEKAWLSEQGIEFVDRNIAEDESALEDLQKLGVFSTPVTLINGAVVVGFDREKLEQLLGLTG